MVRLRRKLFIDTLALGVALTLIVIVASAAGWLDSLENWFYDQRALYCQQFTKPPTTQLVHLDLDDRALEVIGKWPWPRSKLAGILDELGRAKPKVVATDLIFPDAEGITGAAQPDGTFKPVDGDALLAASLKRLGNVIVPAALFTGSKVSSPLATAILAELSENLELTEPELVQRMHQRGFNSSEIDAQIAVLYYPVRREAAFSRVYKLLINPARSTTQPAVTQPSDAIRALLHLPSEDIDYSSPAMNIVRSEYGHAAAIAALRRLTAPVPPNAPPMLSASGSYLAPLLPFSQAASATGFVDFFSQGAVRNVPLLGAHDGRIYPQLGFALALQSLGVDIRRVRLTAGTIVVPRADGSEILIPVRTGMGISNNRERAIPMLVDIPWFGTRDWETMYDWPNHIERKQHVPIIKLWQVGELERKLRKNGEQADAAIVTVLALTDLDKAKAYEEHRPSPEAATVRIEKMAATLEDKDVKSFYDQLSPLAASQQDEDSRKFLAAHRQLREALPQSRQLVQQLADQRAELARDFAGKSVLIGWTATGAAADFVPTPLHDHCPGVVVHGAVFNAVMTNQFWHRTPGWVVGVMTLIFGLLTALTAVHFSALRGLLFTVLLLIVYLFLNGLMLFGYFNLITGVAAPVLTIGFVWAMCTLYRIIVETREREHIKARFQAYVDPVLVNYVLEHPEKASLEGEVKELTVVFTDLANFTTLSEKLGEKSVSLLNDYLGRMVPIIRRHKGYVNKFLGDGIMCFYGAPADSRTHAADAVRTVLDMQSAMTLFNETLLEQNLPPLTVRAGVSTGKMVVGDAGASDASDYTVLGDAVNFGSRLEGANKYFGTRIMVSGRTAEAAAEQFLFRPLGRVRVLGKTEGVDVFEAVAPLDRGTETEKMTVELTKAMVGAFQAQRLEACVKAATALDQHAGGATKLTTVYRELCGKYLAEPPEHWDGTISLTEK
jgi:class 3 adenylate cyclase/CHASE2 domain-containing sensor protein